MPIVLAPKRRSHDAPRIVDKELISLLRFAPAVVIDGPKACGKTATSRTVYASEVLLDTDPDAARLYDVSPPRLLEGPTPRLLDE